MPISGSQAALMQARSAIARAGATRANYACANPHITINGTNRTTKVELSSLHVVLARNDQPSSASFTLLPSAGFTPATSQIVYIGVGSADNYIFGGQIDRLTFRYERGVTNPWIDVECVDFGRLLDRRIVTRKYGSQSASTIAAHILATFTSDFSGYAIESGLDTVPEISFTNETVRGCLLRLAQHIGGAGLFPDARRVVHLFDVTAGDLSAYAGTPPLQLTSSRSTLKEFTYSVDASQIRTRTYVEAFRTSLVVDIPEGTVPRDIPVADAAGLRTLAAGDQVRIGSELADLTHIAGYTDETGVDQFGVPAFDVDIREASDATAVLNTDFTVTGSGTYNITITATASQWYLIFDGINPDIWHPRRTNWLQIGEQIVRFTGYGISPPSPAPYVQIQGIPSSGFGALLADVYTNDTVKILDRLITMNLDGPNASSIISVHRAEEDVVARVSQTDTTAASALAAVEGGDGIHEHLLQDGRLSIASARTLAASDVATFATAIGSCSWITTDYNAMPGRTQSISMTAFTGSLPIAQVDLTWPRDDYSNASTLAKVNAMAKPLRRCTAGTLATSVLDAVTSNAV